MSAENRLNVEIAAFSRYKNDFAPIYRHAEKNCVYFKCDVPAHFRRTFRNDYIGITA